ncbi:MAG: hypothetical protein KJZ93_00380 [Caldilineaceae bacterium]|nr:hypothetical protein [Caldilineaceae bacterium]
MNEQTSEMAKSMLSQVRPWRQGMAWWVVLIEGLIVLGIGIYVLTQPVAGAQIVVLLAAFLLIISVERAINGFREIIPPAILAERMLRAGIGLTVGLIIVFNNWQNFMNPPAPVVILSLGWLLTGAVGIWEWVTGRQDLGLGLGALIIPAISALFGLLMLGSRLALGGVVLQAIGILAVVAGVALFGYSYWLYRQAANRAAISTP